MKNPAIRSAASPMAAGPPLPRLVLAGKLLPLHRQRASARRVRLTVAPPDTVVTTRALTARARALPRSTTRS